MARWLALLALFLYGAAPALACLTPVPAVLGCRPQEEVHSCACRLDAHPGSQCCCGKEAGGSDCRLTSAPCGAPAVPTPAMGSLSFPLAYVAAGALTGSSRLAVRATLPLTFSLRRRPASPSTPPPRA